MELSDRILLGLLLTALAALPVAVFFYLRTAYRSGGWSGVKTACMLVAVAVLMVAGFRLWEYCEFELLRRVLEHPFGTTALSLIVLWWFGHRALKAWTVETHDND
ncbi:MAG: hypothetical protein LAN83_03110 [Acidobacteriia bacterium]|nr:hypothetical protein [Terriglobia bacterium]